MKESCFLHMKATMMKVSDPIIFGHCVKVFFADAFAQHQSVIDAVGETPITVLEMCSPSLKGRITRTLRQPWLRSRKGSRTGRIWPWSTVTGGLPISTFPVT